MKKWIFEIRSRSFVLLLAAFVMLTLLVEFQVTDSFDHASVDFIKSISGVESLDLFMHVMTESGDILYMLIFAIFLLVIKRTRRIGLALMILLVLATLFTGYIKCGVDRDRPSETFGGYPFFIPPSHDTFSLFCEGGYNASFPSGHAARAAVFGVILGFVLSERFPRGCYLLLLYPALMSISRVYVLEHYPMDVIGGALFGLLLAGSIGYKTRLQKYPKSKT